MKPSALVLQVTNSHTANQTIKDFLPEQNNLLFCFVFRQNQVHLVWYDHCKVTLLFIPKLKLKDNKMTQRLKELESYHQNSVE